MSAQSPTASNPKESLVDKLAKFASPAIALIGGIFAWWQKQNPDVVFFAITGLFALASLAISAFLYWAKVDGPLTDPNTNRPFRKLRFKRKWFWIALVSFVFIVAAAVAVRFFFRDEVFPLAVVDRVSGNAFVFDDGQEKPREATIFRLPNHEGRLAYSATRIVIQNLTNERVEIESLVFRYDMVDEPNPKVVATSVFPENETQPNLYVAKLTAGHKSTDATLLHAGSPAFAQASIGTEKPAIIQY